MPPPARATEPGLASRSIFSQSAELLLGCLALAWLSACDKSSPVPSRLAAPVEMAAETDAIENLKRLREGNRLAEAETEAKRLLDLTTANLGPDSPQAIEIFRLLVHILMEIGKRRLPEAIRYAESALASAERTYPPDDLRLTGPIEDLAAAVDYFGSSEEGKLLLERSLAIKQAVLGPDDESGASTLALLAWSQGQLGDYAAKRLLLERARVIFEKKRSKEGALAGVLAGLAMTCASEGDLEAALSFARRAVGLVEQQAPCPGQKSSLALNLDMLADILRDAGRYRESYETYDRVHRIWLEILGPDDGNVTSVLTSKSVVLSAQGRHAEARSMAQAGLTIMEKHVGPEDRSLVMFLRNLATISINAGDDAGAEPLLARALRIRERASGSGHPALRQILDRLAGVQYRLQKDGEALKTALRSEAIGREDFQDRVRILSERQVYRYETSRVSSLQVAFSVLDRGAGTIGFDHAERALDELIRSRALVLDELTFRQSPAIRQEGPEVAALMQEVRFAKTRLAALTLQGTSAAGGVSDQGIADAQARTERPEQELARRSAEQRRRLASRDVRLSSDRGALPPESALASLVQFERLGSATSRAGRRYVPSCSPDDRKGRRSSPSDRPTRSTRSWPAGRSSSESVRCLAAQTSTPPRPGTGTRARSSERGSGIP